MPPKSVFTPRNRRSAASCVTWNWRVGTQLFTRGARGVELTPAGPPFLDHARLALGQAAEAIQAARRAAAAATRDLLGRFPNGAGSRLAPASDANPARAIARYRVQGDKPLFARFGWTRSRAAKSISVFSASSPDGCFLPRHRQRARSSPYCQAIIASRPKMQLIPANWKVRFSLAFRMSPMCCGMSSTPIFGTAVRLSRPAITSTISLWVSPWLPRRGELPCFRPMLNRSCPGRSSAGHSSANRPQLIWRSGIGRTTDRPCSRHSFRALINLLPRVQQAGGRNPDAGVLVTAICNFAGIGRVSRFLHARRQPSCHWLRTFSRRIQDQ